MKRILLSFLFIFVQFLFLSRDVFAEEEKKIQDNSFLIEEAYNQEPGVIQHIQTFQYFKKSKTWTYTFTQEWPVPKQTHQLSYSIPVTHLHDESATGLGDIALNYRYQLLLKEHIALAPRLSLLLPTGDHKRGLGAGGIGYQTNIPFSLELSDKFVTHWNLGYTLIPEGKNGDGKSVHTDRINYGASVIWLATENFNLMLEAAGDSARLKSRNDTKHENNLFISPGMRFAINFKSGLQIVPGIAFPIGMGSSNGEYSAFLYLSFEHPLF